MDISAEEKNRLRRKEEGFFQLAACLQRLAGKRKAAGRRVRTLLALLEGEELFAGGRIYHLSLLPHAVTGRAGLGPVQLHMLYQ